MARADVAGGEEEQLPMPFRQLQLIKDLANKELKAGQSRYLVPKSWWNAFERYCNGEGDLPPAIPTRSLIGVDRTINPSDCVDVPEESWKMLERWYGIEEGTQPVQRRVFEDSKGQAKVDMNPVSCRVTLIDSETMKVLGTMLLRPFISDPVSLLKVDAIKSHGLQDKSPDDFAIFDYYRGQIGRRADDGEQLWDISQSFFPLLALIGKNANGEFPEPATTQTSSAQSYSGAYATGSTASAGSSWHSGSYGSTAHNGSAAGGSYGGYSGYGAGDRGRNFSSHAGQCGMSNLGNTCFMNSGLQCLSHTRELRNFFLSGEYEQDLNPTNPIGCKGELATEFAHLLHELWSGRNNVVSPRKFKEIVGRYAPRFSGYQQHDSQELLAFVLDGLHEDVNRVVQKPYVELEEAGDTPDPQAAQEAWERHLQRNQSRFVELFHAQLRSQLTCPDCGKVSVTFDPFMYLSLPIPDNEKQLQEVKVVRPKSHDLVYSVQVELPKSTGTFKDLKMAVGKELGVSWASLLVADMLGSRLYGVKEDHEKLPRSAYEWRDLWIFEVETPQDAKGPDDVVDVWFKHQVKGSYYSSSDFTPFPVRMCRSTLDAAILKHAALSPHLRRLYLQDPDGDNSPAQPDAPNSTSSSATSKEWDVDDVMNGQLDNQSASADAGIEDGESDDPLDDQLEQTFQQQQQASNGGSTDEDDGRHTNEAEPNPEGMDDGASHLPSVSLSIKLSYASEVDITPETTTDEEGRNTLLDLMDKAKEHDLHKVVVVSVEWAEKPESFADVLKTAKPKQVSASDTLSHGKKTVDLYDCLSLFSTAEQLGQDNMWMCPQCKELKMATKHMQLWNLPPVLVISLKRFSYTRWFRDKLSTFVDFPLRGLDMSRYVLSEEAKKNATYDLYGVVNHMGGLGGGHYTAYALDEDGIWRSYDDSYVSTVSEHSIASTSSYVLFYRRRDLSSANGVAPVPSGQQNGDTHVNSMHVDANVTADEGTEAMGTEDVEAMETEDVDGGNVSSMPAGASL